MDVAIRAPVRGPIAASASIQIHVEVAGTAVDEHRFVARLHDGVGDDHACIGRADDLRILEAEHLQQKHQPASAIGKRNRVLLAHQAGKCSLEFLHRGPAQEGGGNIGAGDARTQSRDHASSSWRCQYPALAIWMA